MKKAYIPLLCFFLIFSSCGGSSEAEIATDKFIKTAELYSSLAPTIANLGDSSLATDFSEWGIALSDYGSRLESADNIPDHELSAMITSLDNIYANLSAIKPNATDNAIN